MSWPKIVLSTALMMLGLVAIVGIMKKSVKKQKGEVATEIAMVEDLEEPTEAQIQELARAIRESAFEEAKSDLDAPLPKDVDRISRLFSLGNSKLPIVETVTYTSRVPWLQGRPAWIADYASYYTTSRHFIARSLNCKEDYYTQKVSSGDRFNVFAKDKDVEFYCVVDLSLLKMWFYAIDVARNERILLKTYPVGVGKIDPKSSSGCLTPLGKYVLSEKVAIYKPGVEGYFQDEKIDLVTEFGTRWIPYVSDETDMSSSFVKGFGIHGTPWKKDVDTGEYTEDMASVGKYSSSGCTRMLQKDIEELFSIVITKKTTIEFVKHFNQARIPGVDWEDPFDVVEAMQAAK